MPGSASIDARYNDYLSVIAKGPFLTVAVFDDLAHPMLLHSILEEIMITRTVLLICLVLASSCICVGQESGARMVELVTVDDLSVRLRVKSSASLADEKWIVLEFENRGAKAVTIDDATYRLESRGFDVATGELQYSGGLGQGGTFDLFGSNSSPIAIEPGTTEIWKHPSDYASALVNRQKQAVTIRVDVHFSLTLQDRRRFRFKPRTDGEGDVSFTWHKLDDADVDRARSRLKDLWQRDRLPEDFFQLRTSIKTGMTAGQVRDILGSHLKDEREGNRARRLYLEPQFRFSLGDNHWLRFDEADKVIKWHVAPWNKLYDPASAPSVTRWMFGEQEVHGVWDDVIAIEDRDIVIARRGPEWWKFTVPELKLEKIGDFPDLKRVRVRHSIDADAQLWLLCDSPDVAPFALEINSGKRVPFTIDGAKLPASIQSYIVAPTRTVILMISGGDRTKWPRGGNRPIYYWMDLNTGASRQLPIGWDLSSFTSDQRIAMGNTKLAIDMRTGNPVVTKSDTVKNAGQNLDERIKYNWTNTALAQPLSNQQRDLVGFSLGGETYRSNKPFSNPHLPEFATRDKRVAFHLRRHGDETRPWCLWTAAMGPVIDPVLISENVDDWRLLSGDHCVFGSKITTPAGVQNEAFVYEARTGKMSDILDDVVGLPQGASRVHFRSCFGDPRNGRLVLCEATGTAGNSIQNGHWKRWAIVTSAGRRYIVEDFPRDLFADVSRTWLHNSGTLLISTYSHDSRVNPPLIQFKLSTVKLTGK